MSKEYKELLLRDLCGRLPYGVKFHYFSEFADGEDPEFDNTITVIDIADEQILDEDHEDYIPLRQILPYLRPMSSMTEEEKEEYDKLFTIHSDGDTYCENWEWMDFMNSHHFDYRGLIPKGLALEAPEGMYNVK